MNDIVAGIRSVKGPGTAVLHEPQFSGNELLCVKECPDSAFVSSDGRFVDRFEAELAGSTRTARAVAVVNDTAALHLSMVLADMERGDELLMPPLIFAATANAICLAAAMPHLVDSEARTLGADPLALCEDLDSMRKRRSSDCELLTRNAESLVLESNANCSATYLRRE